MNSNAEEEHIVRYNKSTVRVNIELNRNTEKYIEETRLQSDFGLFYGFCLLASIVTFLADMYMHCWLAYIFYEKKEFLYFILTATFIIIPSVISTGFSMRWYILDEDDELSPSKPSFKKWTVRIITMLLQITQIHRYCDAFCYGLRSIVARYNKDQLKEDHLYRKMLDEDCDAALLRLFYSVLNSAPQAVLQLTIFISHEVQKIKTSYQDYQLSSVIVSSFSVAWSLVVYNRTARYIRDDKERLSWKGIILHFFLHLSWIVSRVIALSIMTAFYPKLLLLGCALHSSLMTLWLLFRRDGNYSRCDECVLSCMLGVAYVFIYISSYNGPHRYSYSVYYLVCLVENIGCLAIWYQSTNLMMDISFRYGIIIAQIGLYSISVLCMLLYYGCFHPHKTAYKIKKPKKQNAPEKPLMRH